MRGAPLEHSSKVPTLPNNMMGDNVLPYEKANGIK